MSGSSPAASRTSARTTAPSGSSDAPPPAKIISDATYAIVLFMTAVTTILAPPVLRYLFKPPAAPQAAVAD